MSEYRIDSHKMFYHPKEVSKWLNGEEVFPITMELSPSGKCNHRCVFCSQSYLGYKNTFLTSNVIKKNIVFMKDNGLKSVVLAGEGEPLLNSEINDLISIFKEKNIDVALSTNGVLINDNFIQKSLKKLSWIRISFNGATEEIYNKIHGLNKNSKNYSIVFNNIKKMVEHKRNNGLNTTIGVQMILLPENLPHIELFAQQLKEIGVDYFTIKPFSKHPCMKWDIKDEVALYDNFNKIKNKLEELNTETYKVIIRSNSIKQKFEKKQYERCHGLPFWLYISSNGDVYPCLSFIGNKDYCIGNINTNNFSEIWLSKAKRNLYEKMQNMDISKCRKLCRLDKINQYLDYLKNEDHHDHRNFI